MMQKNKIDIINIMFIIDYLYGGDGGGTEKHLSYLVNNLDRNRFKPVVAAYDTGDTPLVSNIKAAGTDVIHIPVGRYYTPNAVFKTVKFSRMMRDMKIDIVQTYHFKADTIGVLSAKLAGVNRIISSKRDIGDTKLKIHFCINQMINLLVDDFIVVADKVGDVLIEKEKLPRNRITTIYNGVDTNYFSPLSSKQKLIFRRRIGIAEDDYVIGMVAVFRPEKDHEVFFKAFQKITQHIDKAKVIVVGDGPLYNYYRKYVTDNQISEKVIFTGATSDVKQYLSTMDVGCLVPGSNEGFSNSILEKMAMGLPMVVTDVGGNAEAVLNGYNGFVVPPYDAGAIAKSLIGLYKNPGLRTKMGEKARKRVENYFSLPKMIANYENYYINLNQIPRMV